MATSSALKEKIAAIKAKQAANLAAMKGEQVAEVAKSQSPTTPPATPIPTPQPHVIKPSLVTMEGAGEYEPFKMKLAELEQQLEDNVPGYAHTLRDLHREMAQDPNVVTILTEDEISIIVKGVGKHMDTTVVVAKKTSLKRTQPIQLDEL